jgi:hypothetical protein
MVGKSAKRHEARFRQTALAQCAAQQDRQTDTHTHTACEREREEEETEAEAEAEADEEDEAEEEEVAEKRERTEETKGERDPLALCRKAVHDLHKDFEAVPVA